MNHDARPDPTAGVADQPIGDIEGAAAQARDAEPTSAQPTAGSDRGDARIDPNCDRDHDQVDPDDDTHRDLHSEVARLTDALARTQAEFANYRKRIARDSAAAAERTKAAVVEALVPVLDAFDAATAHDDEAAGPLRTVLMDATRRIGLCAVAPDPGDLFDPTTHHAVSGPAGDGNQDELVVTSVVRPGYRIGQHLLRAAEVEVDGRDGTPEAT